jgi:hypothetical protein
VLGIWHCPSSTYQSERSRNEEADKNTFLHRCRANLLPVARLAASQDCFVGAAMSRCAKKDSIWPVGSNSYANLIVAAIYEGELGLGLAQFQIICIFFPCVI